MQGQLADKSHCEERALWGGPSKGSPLPLGAAFGRDSRHWNPPGLCHSCVVVMPVPGHVAHWPGPLILTQSLTTLGPHHFGLAHQSGPRLTLFLPDLLCSLRIVGLHPIGEGMALPGRQASATTIPALVEQPTLPLTERVSDTLCFVAVTGREQTSLPSPASLFTKLLFLSVYIFWLLFPLFQDQTLSSWKEKIRKGRRAH